MPPRKRKLFRKKRDEKATDVPSDYDLDSEDEDKEDGEGHRRGRPPERLRPTATTTTAVARQRGLVSTFFSSHTGPGGSKSIADLNLGIAGDQSLRSLVASLPERFPAEKAAIRSQIEAQFPRWWSEWQAGHSLLFYGYGSKKHLLHRFVTAFSTDGACIAVKGLQPGLTARQILLHVAATITSTRTSTSTTSRQAQMRSKPPAELLDLIASQHPARKIYVLIHNIDGPGLRDQASQRLLSEVAALPNVHLAASVDHINAPLLWDMQTKDRFGWLWHQVATFEPYIDELVVSSIPSLLSGEREVCTQQSALVVLSSLSRTAKEVFRLISEAQLDTSSSGSGGITFQRLFASCREKFLVSNEMLLKSFLTEFRDHELLGSKRTGEGEDVLCVPLDNGALQQVLDTME